MIIQYSLPTFRVVGRLTSYAVHLGWSKGSGESLPGFNYLVSVVLGRESPEILHEGCILLVLVAAVPRPFDTIVKRKEILQNQIS